jgi:hypothetical protein
MTGIARRTSNTKPRSLLWVTWKVITKLSILRSRDSTPSGLMRSIRSAHPPVHQETLCSLSSLLTLAPDQSIKELWQLAYRGGDIDSIEIVSGDESATGRALKSYNYRVVMRKGDVPLDMRVCPLSLCPPPVLLTTFRVVAPQVKESWQVL